MKALKQIKHLAIVSPSFPKNEENEIVVPPLHIYVRQLKVDYPDLRISVICLHYPFHKKPYSLYGVDVYPCGGSNGPFVKRPLLWQRFLKLFKQLNQEQPIDLIHNFWLNESALLGQWMSKKFGIPHFCTMMGQDARPQNRYLPFLNLKKMELIALSEFQKNALQKHRTANQISVIPWGIAPFDIELNPNSDRPIDFICVSSLIPLKRIHLFVELVSELKKGYSEIKAVIIGGGPLQKEIETQIVRLKLEQNVTLKGLLPRKESLKWMQNSKALVHTSEYEAQGYVLNEALASGCEVFALSQGFLSDDSKLHVENSFEELLHSAKKYLQNAPHNYESHIPLYMADSVELYKAVYAKKGLIL